MKPSHPTPSLLFSLCWLDAKEYGDLRSRMLEMVMERWTRDGKRPDPWITAGGEILSDLQQLFWNSCEQEPFFCDV